MENLGSIVHNFTDSIEILNQVNASLEQTNFPHQVALHSDRNYYQSIKHAPSNSKELFGDDETRKKIEKHKW